MKNVNPVYFVSLAIVLLLVLIGILSPALLDGISSAIHQWIITNFGWGYLLSAFIFLVFSILVAFSRFGTLKLGKDHEEPQYSYFGWFSMLFAAGMGIGLVFWGVAEPVSIDVSTNGTGIMPDTELCEMVREHFDLSPSAIIDRLDLLKPRYQKTAAYGHFGRPAFPWEELTHVEALKRDAAEVTA